MRLRIGLVIGLLLATAAPARAGRYQLELGAFAGAHFFSSASYLGRYPDQGGGTALDHSAALGIRLAYGVHPRVFLEGELTINPTGTANDQAQVLVIGYRANVLVHLLTGRVRPFVLVGGGGLTSSSSNPDMFIHDTDGEFHGGVGIKVDVNKARTWGLRADGRALWVPALAGGALTTEGEVFVGVYGLFGAFGPPAPPPAPPVNPDPDQDGVMGADDRCPDKAGPKENAGCPDTDKDADGFVDRLDKCPEQAGIQENDGCPDTDRDADGVVDRLDKCPEQAGPPENGGCPDTDQDGDGVVDRLDKCPAEKETPNGYHDDDGCPDEIPAAVKKFTGAIQGIQFASGKAVLLPASSKVLDQAVQVLKDNADVKLEIQGHTDNAGPREKNVTLSQARADAVKDYFVGKGIAAERVTAKGYGPDQPVADNKSASGKAKNRRVEFKLVN